MDIKKLNEQLDKLLREPINEISDELKQKVIDARQAEYLAAQATADRKKAKFDKISKLGKRLEKKTPETVINSLKDIGDTLDVEYSEPKSYGDDYVMILTVPEYFENGKLTKSAEEELRKLLEEMSDKYGCKYTYKVEKNTVKIICEKPKLGIDKLDKNSDEYNSTVLYPLYRRCVAIFKDMLAASELPRIDIYDYYEPEDRLYMCASPIDNSYEIQQFFIFLSVYGNTDLKIGSDLKIGYRYDPNVTTEYLVSIDHPISDEEIKKVIKKVYMKFYKEFINQTLTQNFMMFIERFVVKPLYNIHGDYVDGTFSSFNGHGFIKFYIDGWHLHYIYIYENKDSLEFRELNENRDLYTSRTIKKSDLTIENIKSVIKYIVDENNRKFEELQRTEK